MINQQDTPEKSNNAGAFLLGLLFGVLPPVFAFLFGRSTFIIASRPIASWFVDLYVLIGTFVLLVFPKMLKGDNRRAVEWALFLGALALFVTKWMTVGVPK